MTSIPAVSVILPTHNRRPLLPRAMESVLQQTFGDLELVVVDDGSTDGTVDYVRGLADSRVRCLSLCANHGQSAARNAGILRARAPLVAFQDSDDVWVEDKLAEQVRLLHARPEAAMIYGDLLRIPFVGDPYVIPAPDLSHRRTLDDRPTRYASYGLGIQTCLVRGNVLRRLGGFKARMRCLEDMELFLRLARQFLAVRIPRVLVKYYETDGVSKMQEHQRDARRYLLCRYALDILRTHPSWLWREWDNLRYGRQLGA